MKKLLITLLKVALSLAIIAYLVWKSTRGEANANAFVVLRDRPKDWGVLGCAWGCCLLATLLTFVRWWYLVIALGVPLRFRDAIRIGFWGYLLNMAPLGIVGGDVVKAVMLDHECPNYRAKVLASVIFDRAVGLYLLFVVASAALLITGFWRTDVRDLQVICYATFIVTAVGGLAIAAILGPGISNGRILAALARIPRVGRFLHNVIEAVRMYARKPTVLILSSLMSIGVHSLFAVGCYLIARGLFEQFPSLGMQFVIMPLGSATQVIPLSFGPFEVMLDFLYAHAHIAQVVAGQGFVVALGYRAVALLIALLGLPYYFGNRREMAEVIHEVEVEAPELELAGGEPQA